MSDQKEKRSRKKGGRDADHSELAEGAFQMSAEPVGSSKSAASLLTPRLFALIVDDKIESCVRALSSREARGKGEVILGGVGGRPFAAAITRQIYPVEVVTVRQRLEEVLHDSEEGADAALAQKFVSESGKAVLMQVLGWKPAGLEGFQDWLRTQLPPSELLAHFPLNEAFVMWEGSILATAPSLEAFEANFAKA